MKVLKNSSGKVLLSGGNPIIQSGSSDPVAATIAIGDSTSTYYFNHYNLNANTITLYSRPESATITGYVGDIITVTSYNTDEYEYSGVTLLDGDIGTTGWTGKAFKVTATSASILITCFVAGSKVSMADGTFKNIEDIIIGDKVLGYDGTNYVEVEVLRTFKHNYSGKIYTVKYGKKSFEATGNHPIYINGEYKRVDTLQVGDKVFCNGKNVSITSIETKDVENIFVYNLDVSDTNNYIVNMCLAHNKPS